MAATKITALTETVTADSGDLLAVVTDPAGTPATKKITKANLHAGLSADGHSHAIADTTGLQTALDGKAAASHAHTIADTTGLQTALDGKAAASHTHTKSQITDFAHTHAAGDLPDASTTAKGVAELATSAETTAGLVVQASDTRLSDARTPVQHSITGAEHSFPGGTSTFLRADGSFATPPGGGGEAFPVGSVFIAVVATNPATLLGYGTWAAFAAGRVLVGLDAGQTEFDTVEETGGAKTHTLTAAEMPSHTHVQDPHTHQFLPRSGTTGSVSSIVTGTLDTSSTISGANQPHVQNATATNQNTGGGGAHNNLQPYVVVYMWKRTA